MPLIQPRKQQTFITQKIKIDEDIYNNIKQYMEAFELGDDIDNFFEAAAKQVLEKDRDYQKYLKAQKKKPVEPEETKPAYVDTQETSEEPALA